MPSGGVGSGAGGGGGRDGTTVVRQKAMISRIAPSHYQGEMRGCLESALDRFAVECVPGEGSKHREQIFVTVAQRTKYNMRKLHDSVSSYLAGYKIRMKNTMACG